MVFGLLLFLTSSVTLSESYPKHIEIALGEVGINKKDDKQYIIKNYLEPLGIKDYANFCAAYVTFCLDKAGDVVDYIRTAVAQKFITKESIKASDVLDGKVTIPAGSIVIWKWIGSWKGHVGFVIKDWIGKLGFTVEGNTSNNSTHAGGNVEEKTRTINRHSSFRITHFTLVNYIKKDLSYNIKKFAANLGILPKWNMNIAEVL